MPPCPTHEPRAAAAPHPGAARRRARRWVSALSLCAFALAAGACKKESESLVIVALTAAPADATLTTVSITAATVARTFGLPAGRGLSSTPISFGLYLPSGVGGQIAIAATATGTSGGACAGYQGN